MQPGGAGVFKKLFNRHILFKSQTLLYDQIKLMVKMKPTDDNRLTNRLIANKLI